jgi:hypothetical protein
MWENQLSLRKHFLPPNQKVVHLSKLGFPTSDPALMVSPLNHGLESHATKRRGIAHGYLELVQYHGREHHVKRSNYRRCADPSHYDVNRN